MYLHGCNYFFSNCNRFIPFFHHVGGQHIVKITIFKGVFLMNCKEFQKPLEQKQIALSKIAHSQTPINPVFADRHEEKIFNAKQFIEELKLLDIETSLEIYVVSKGTFQKRVDSADFAAIESDGFYHSMALISAFGSPDYYLIWMESLSNL